MAGEGLADTVTLRVKAFSQVLILGLPADVEKIILEGLVQRGCLVKVSGDFAEALALLKVNAFDLILMAMNDGAVAVIRQVKADEALRNIPVLVLGTDLASEKVLGYVGAGAEDCLPLGGSTDVLFARVDVCLAEKKVRDGEQASLRRLRREITRTNELLKVVIGLGAALSGERDSARLLERILKEAKSLCNADAGTLYVRTDDDHLKFAMMSTDSLGIALGGTTGREITFPPIPLRDPRSGQPNQSNLSSFCALTGRSINIPDIRMAEGFDFSGTRAFDERNRYKSVSSLTVPMKNHANEVIGVLQLINAQNRHGEVVPFSPQMQELVESLASQAAVALNNQNLLERQKTLVKYERDVQIGRKIQSDFLPEALPSIDGWEIAARFRPAREVAGDFYDAFPLGDGSIGLVIGDVCDKGVGAALFMAIFRSLIRAFAEQGCRIATEPSASAESSATIMARAVQMTNDYIANTHGRTSMFATLFYGALDTRTGLLSYGNAGHEPPVICRPDGTRIRLAPTGPAGGLISGAQIGTKESMLQPGDVLLAYTDGVTDARNAKNEFYTEKRFLALIQEPAESATALLDRVEGALVDHIADTPPFDDITLLSVRRVPQ
jgi:phosphoserine phosphatase RsbU/P